MRFSLSISLLGIATLAAASFPLIPRQTNTTNSTTTPISPLILPLGDSITFGYGSSTGNGYRLDLASLLSNSSSPSQYNNTNVTYIGSIHSGSMLNDANEGHGGAIISEILKNGTNYLSTLATYPNLILVMAGTNDMNDNTSVADAPERLSTLINTLISLCPSTTILVADLVPSLAEATEERIQVYNAAIPGVVAARVAEGYHVGFVNMTAFVGTGDMNDALHPNDSGYAKMAQAWYQGVLDVESKGWVEEPGKGEGTVDPLVGAFAVATATATATASTTSASASASATATGTGKRNEGLQTRPWNGWWVLVVLFWGSGVGMMI